MWNISVLAAALMLVQGEAPPVEPPPGYEDMPHNAHFMAIGWYCGGEGCSRDPRDLQENVFIHADSITAGFDATEMLVDDWNVTMACSVKRDRLVGCRRESDSDQGKKPLALGTALIRSLRLAPAPAGTPGSGRRVLITVQYIAAQCPNFACTITPPPPPPPPRLR